MMRYKVNVVPAVGVVTPVAGVRDCVLLRIAIFETELFWRLYGQPISASCDV